ncbi:MAG: 4Fe-4S binding protein [Bacillota bacterium]
MEFPDIVQVMTKYLAETPLNRVNELGIKRIFEDPLVGLAAADDPLFFKLKEPEVIGERHLLPTDWLPEAKTVISYFLPFSVEIRRANYQPGLPAREWVYGRIEGEECNNALRRHVVEEINRAGGKALAPVLDPRFSVVEKRSNWSERHVAFIAGLGTFGLSKSLITQKGCAGRYGSVVTSLPLKPTSRSYEEVYQYCTMCGECIDRCPSGAIKKEGKDIRVCSQYLDTKIKPFFYPRYGCGKCQTAVPCEHSIPQ